MNTKCDEYNWPCKNPLSEDNERVCPFAEEIHEEIRYCDCCDTCAQKCADDI